MLTLGALDVCPASQGRAGCCCARNSAWARGPWWAAADPALEHPQTTGSPHASLTPACASDPESLGLTRISFQNGRPPPPSARFYSDILKPEATPSLHPVPRPGSQRATFSMRSSAGFLRSPPRGVPVHSAACPVVPAAPSSLLSTAASHAPAGMKAPPRLALAPWPPWPPWPPTWNELPGAASGLQSGTQHTCTCNAD